MLRPNKKYSVYDLRQLKGKRCLVHVHVKSAEEDGLPVLAAGGKADVVCMDGELSKDVDQVSAYAKLNRAKIILECIRTGVQPLYNKLMRDRIVQSQDHAPEDADTLLAIMEQTQQLDDPMQRELRTALRQRGAALVRLNDILAHVPEARRRRELIERLTEFCQDPGGLRVGVWGAGLSTEEIEWQIKMVEKYGNGGKLPEEEIKSREIERERERRAGLPHNNECLTPPYPQK